MDIQAPVTEPADVSASEAEFWEFDSPLGHQLFTAGGAAMRRRNTPTRTIVVRPAKPSDPLALAVARRLGAFIFRRHAPDRLGRMDLDQRVRELGEW